MSRRLVGGGAIAAALLVCAASISAAADRVSARAGANASVPPELVPNAIAFWDAERGLIGTGFHYCNVGRCDRGTISITTDGGRTSRVVLRTRQPVTWVAVARARYAWAISGGLLWRSEDNGRSWERLGAAMGFPSFADESHGMSCQFAVCPESHWLVASDDGGRGWRAIASPCGRGVSGLAGVSLVTPLRGWALCVGEGGAGNQSKAVFGTRTGGKTWTRLVRVQSNPDGGLSGYGYAQGIAFAPNGVGLLWESRGTLYLTLDGGLRWKPLQAVARPEIDFGSSASVVPGRAFALLDEGNRLFRLVATTHGYAGWKTLRRWRFAVRD